VLLVVVGKNTTALVLHGGIDTDSGSLILLLTGKVLIMMVMMVVVDTFNSCSSSNIPAASRATGRWLLMPWLPWVPTTWAVGTVPAAMGGMF